MKNIYLAMIRTHLLFHSIAALGLGATWCFDKLLGFNFFSAGISLYALFCFILVFLKPYSMPNWTWLRTLPVARHRLLTLVFVEGIFPVVFAALGAIVELVHLDDVGAFRALTKRLPQVIMEGVHHVTLGRLAICAYAFFLCVPFIIGMTPVALHRRGFVPANLRRAYFKIALGLAVCAFGLYVAPVILGIAFIALLVSWAGRNSINTIFTTQKMARLAGTYGAVLFIMIFSAFFAGVEFYSAPGARQVLRVQYYGKLAPRVSPEEIIKILARTDISDSTRIEIARSGHGFFDRPDYVPTGLLHEWSRIAPSDGAYFEGLTYFMDQVWDANALIALEGDFSTHCSGGLQASKVGPHWTCKADLPENLELNLNIKETPTLNIFLSEKSPLVASLLIHASLEKEFNFKDRKVFLEMLSNSDMPILQQQAQLWLARAEANPRGIWNCERRYRSPSSACGEWTGTDGLKIEGTSPGAHAGSIALHLSHGG